MSSSYGPGVIVRAKYRVERVLGEGGMGIVLLATHLKLDQPVALKILRPSLRDRAGVVARFGREARAIAKLKNKHIVRVLDVDETEDGDPFLVMEYLVGSDLERILETDGRLQARRAAKYILQVCEGMAEAHAAGIIHRDLKPANMFVITDGDSVKILDFGIAKSVTPLADGEQQPLKLTTEGTLLGSPIYMSPEQLKRTEGVDARSDIWSLGVVLFQLVTGKLPFEADTSAALAAMIASEPARAFLPGDLVPAAYASIVERCLQKVPADRFASMDAHARALADVEDEAPAPPTPPKRSQRVTAAITVEDEEAMRAALPATVQPASAKPAGAAPSSRSRPRPRLAALLIPIALVAVLALIVVRSLIMRPSTPGPPGRPVVMIEAKVALTISDAGVGFDDLTFAEKIDRVVVPAGETGRVLLVDPKETKGTHTIETIVGFSETRTIRGGHTQGPTSATYAGNNTIAVIDRTAKELLLADSSVPHKIMDKHALAAVPDYVRHDPLTNWLWVTEPDAERIEIFSTKSRLELVTTIEVPGGPEYLVFDSSRGRAFTNLWKGSTMMIDLQTKRLKGSFPNGCDGSRTLALDEVRALLFVACVEGVVTSIDLSHGSRIVGRFDYHQSGIDALAYDATRSLLYAPSAKAGKMAALHIDRDGQPSLAFEVRTQTGAACATIDASGTVWICDPIHGQLLTVTPPN